MQSSHNTTQIKEKCLTLFDGIVSALCLTDLVCLLSNYDVNDASHVTSLRIFSNKYNNPDESHFILKVEFDSLSHCLIKQQLSILRTILW